MDGGGADLAALYAPSSERLTTDAMIAPYEADITELVAWADYKTAIEKVDETTDELVLDDATAINAFVDSIIDDSEVIVFAATYYDSLLQTQKEMNERIDATGYRTAIGDTDVETALAAVAAEIAEATYRTAVEVAREATDEETFEPFTVEQKTQMIMDYIEAACVDMEYEALCVELVYNVATKATEADATIDAYSTEAGTPGYLAPAEVTALKASYADVENKPDLAEIYTASGKGTADYYGDDEDLFDALEETYTGYIDNVLTIAANENAMNKNTADELANDNTYAATTTVTDVIEAKLKFDEAIIQTQSNFEYVTSAGIKGADADGAVMADIAAQSTADLATLKVDQKAASEAYKEYIALIPLDDSDDVYIYGYKEVGDDEFELVDIEDDAEFEKVAAEFDKITAEEAQLLK